MFKTWSYFQTVCLCNSCARKIRNLGALFEVIRSAIGSESAVSQTPSKQTIHLCIKTAAPNSIRQQSLSQECSCRCLRVGKSLPQVFEICRRIRTKMILRGTSGKNSDSEKNSPISRTSSLCSCGSSSMNITDLIDGFITWQSTLPCRANQEAPFVDERVFQNRGVCGQAFRCLLSPPPPRTFLRPPQFSRGQKSEKCIKRAESLTETLATQAILF